MTDIATPETATTTQVYKVYIKAPATGRFAYCGDTDKTESSYRGDHVTLGELAAKRPASIPVFERLGLDPHKVRIVLNRANTSVSFPVSEVTKSLGVPLFAEIPSDVTVPRSMNDGHPAVTKYPRAKVSKAVTRMTDELLGLLFAEGTSEVDLARAVANQTAVAIKKIELIERLTEKNLIKDFFEQLAGVPAEVDYGSEFRYRRPVLDAGTTCSRAFWASVASWRGV